MEITLGSIVSYVVGVPLLLVGLALTFQSPLGLIPLLGGLLVIPPVRRNIDDKAGVSFSRGATAGIGTVSVVVAIALLAIIGASGSGGIPGADVSNVSVTANDADPSDAETSLAITWNSRAQSAVDPDTSDISTYDSEDGQKFVVLRTTIENTGENPLDLDPRLIRFESAGVVYEYQGLFGTGNSFSGVTLNPEGEHSAWLSYSVPGDTTEGQLVVNQDAYFQQNVSVEFTQDPNKAINMSD